MFAIPHSLIALAETLELRWKSYREGGDSDVFVEFTLSLNSLTEQLSQQHLPGLVRACQELETPPSACSATVRRTRSPTKRPMRSSTSSASS